MSERSQSSASKDLNMTSPQIPRSLKSVPRKSNESPCQVPDNETARLLILKQSRILDSDRNDVEYDRYTALTQRILQVPLAFLTFIDFDRQWMKSETGITVGNPSVDRRNSIDALAMFPTVPEIICISDITTDPMYQHFQNPFGLSDPSIVLHFYAGAVISVDGFRLGVLSAVDTQPRPYLSLEDRQTLYDLAAAVSSLVKERRQRHLRFRKERANLMLGLNHNLRTPLMSLTLVTEMLRNELKQLALSKAAIIEPVVADTNYTKSPQHRTSSIIHRQGPLSTSILSCSNSVNYIHMEGAADTNTDEESSFHGNKHLFSSLLSSTEVGSSGVSWHHITIPHVPNLYIPRADSESFFPDFASSPDCGAASGTHHGLLSARKSQSHSTNRQYAPDVPCMSLLGDLQGCLQQLGLLVEMGLVLGKITSGLSVLADGTYDSILCDVLKVFEKVQALTQRMDRSQNVLWNIDRKNFSVGKQYSHPDVLMSVLISLLAQLLPHSDMIKIKSTFIPVEEVARIIEDTSAAQAMAAITDFISSTVVVGRVGILMTELEIFGDVNNLKEIVSKLHVTSNEKNEDKSRGANSQSDSSYAGDIIDPTPFIDPDVEEFGGSIFALGSLLDNALGGSAYVMKNHGCVFSFSIPMRIEIDPFVPNYEDNNNMNPSSNEQRNQESESTYNSQDKNNVTNDIPVRQQTVAGTGGYRCQIHTVLPSIPSVIGENMSENSSIYLQKQEAIREEVRVDIIDDVDSVDEYDIIEDEAGERSFKLQESRVSDSKDNNLYRSNEQVMESYEESSNSSKFQFNEDNKSKYDNSSSTKYDKSTNDLSSDTGLQSSGSKKEPMFINIEGEPIIALPNTSAFFETLEKEKTRLIKVAEFARKMDPAFTEAMNFQPSLSENNNQSQAPSNLSTPQKLEGASKKETALTHDNILSQNDATEDKTMHVPAVKATSTAKNDIVMSLKDMIVGSIPTRDRALRVLMVDDSLTVQKVMGIWLSKKNCVVSQALNGQVALDLMKNTAFDIVFMDFLMPVMDGLTCIRLYGEFIETAPISLRPVGFKHQWIIGLSASALRSDLEAAFQANMHMFCAKPVDMQALSYILEAKRHGLTYETIRDIASSNRAVKMSLQQKSDASIIMVPDTLDSNLSMDRETMRNKLDNNFNMNIFGSFIFNL